MKAQEQIEKLKTLQESLDSLSNTYKELTKSSDNIVLSDVAEGKKQIADAINYKGGEAEATQAFSTLAEEIKKIPNMSEYFRLAGVLAGSAFIKNALEGHNENVAAGSTTRIIDKFGVFTRINNNAFQNWDLLEEVDLPVLTSIGNNAFASSSIKTVKAESLTNLGNQCFENSALEFFYAPNLQQISSARPLNCSGIIYIVFGTLLQINNVFYNNVLNLRNITIGNNTNINLPYQNWVATNVIAEGQSGIDELNNNLYNNLLTKLYDHSTDGETRTLHLGWLAHVTQENIDYANSKGWTLTT